MPRRSSSPSLSQKKIITMPSAIEYKKNIPAIIVAQKPSFLQTMKEGFGLGIGSSIGHRIVGSILGSTNISTSSVIKNDEYEQCMKDNNDKTGCEYLLRSQ